MLAATVLTWLWTTTSALNQYNLQLTGALTLLYFGSKFFLRSSNHHRLDITSTAILNSICLLLIFSTGGLSSPLFFLLFFLLITLALLFEPIQAVVVSVTLVFIFLLDNYSSLGTTKIINLLSLLVMTPIALAFSRNYLAILVAKGRINILEKALEDTESDSLLWISRTKPSLASVLNSTTDLVMYFNSKGRQLLLPPAIVDKLKAIQNDLITLYSSTSSLEKTLESEADKVKL